MSADLSDGATTGYTPSASDLRIINAALAGWKAYTRPSYDGLEHIPEHGPCFWSATTPR